jgi:hypothetical protein
MKAAELELEKKIGLPFGRKVWEKMSLKKTTAQIMKNNYERKSENRFQIETMSKTAL